MKIPVKNLIVIPVVIHDCCSSICYAFVMEDYDKLFYGGDISQVANYLIKITQTTRHVNLRFRHIQPRLRSLVNSEK